MVGPLSLKHNFILSALFFFPTETRNKHFLEWPLGNQKMKCRFGFPLKNKNKKIIKKQKSRLPNKSKCLRATKKKLKISIRAEE